jgi:stage II sporulation protein D
MRRLALPVVILVVLASAAGAAASPVFVLKGHGWGHGVGLSQYGALGRANDGQDYKQILGFYYDGTNVGQTSQKKIRVLLMEGQTSVTLHSSESFKVGDKTLARFTDWKLVPTSDGRVRVVGKGKFGSPVTAKPGEGFLRIDGLRYRGNLKIHNRGGSLAVVNVVGLQGYLYSVVPREMPSSWLPEALKAQAVAARGYAVRAARASWYDVYDDTRDQVYGGLDYSSGEDPGSTAAVKATAGELLKYGGDAISAYFSSSNGGEDGSLGGHVGRLAPISCLAAGPVRPERVEPEPQLDRGALAARAAEPVRRAQDSRGRRRHVEEIRARRPCSPRAKLLGSDPSVVGPGPGMVPHRARTPLEPIRLRRPRCDAREREGRLQRPPPGQRPGEGGTGRHAPAAAKWFSSWTDMSLTKDDAAHYHGLDRPCRATSYRLHSSVANSTPAGVKVAPKIVFSTTQPANDGLEGSVRPRSLAGQTVHVDRKRGDGTWAKNVGSAVVQSDGKWHAKFNAVSGTYRARLAPPSSTGLVSGSTGEFNFN